MNGDGVSSAGSGVSGQRYDLGRPDGIGSVDGVLDGVMSYTTLHIAVVLLPTREGSLGEASDAWAAASGRLTGVAETLREKASAVTEVWSGSEASVSFQRSLKRLHDTVTALADAADGMRRMVRTSADFQSEVLAGFPFDDAILANDLTDHMSNMYLRMLVDAYSQAIQDHGPADLTVDYPGIVDTNMGRNEIDGGAGAELGESGTAVGRGFEADGLGGGTDGRPPWGGAQAGSPLSGEPSGGGSWAPPVGAGEPPTFGADPVGGGGGSALVDPPYEGPPWGYSNPPGGDTSLAGYSPRDAGAGYGGAAGSGGVPGSGFGSGAGVGSGLGSGPGGGAGGVGGFGLGGGAGRAGAAGSGMGMVPPGAGGADDDEEEHPRSSWLSEDLDVWGTRDVQASPAVLGAAEPERPRRGRRPRDVSES